MTNSTSYETPSIYITNLGKYNEGELIGKWIDLPISKKDFIKELKSIQVEPNSQYEEYFISDWENMPKFMNEFTCNIEELNEYANIQNLIYEKINNLGNNNQYSSSQIDFIIDTLSSVEIFKEFNCNIDELKDAIEDATIFISDFNSHTNAFYELGYFYLENDMDYLDLPDDLKMFINVQDYGYYLAETMMLLKSVSENDDVIIVFNK